MLNLGVCDEAKPQKMCPVFKEIVTICIACIFALEIWQIINCFKISVKSQIYAILLGIVFFTIIEKMSSFLSLLDITTTARIPETFSAAVASVALVFTIHEYNKYRTREQFATLAEYNKRYSDTSYMATCLEFLTKCLNNQICIVPSINQREMFFRFFEELQIQVEAGRLDKEKVKDLFAYYGVAAFLVKSFADDIIEFDSDNIKERENSKKTWNKYYKFLQENKDIAEEVMKEKSNTYGELLSEDKYQYIKNLKQ